MTPTVTAIARQRCAAAALGVLAATLPLGWELNHGGIRSHHLLQRADLPGLSNAWGLALLPVLAAWALGSVRVRGARAWAAGVAVPLALGAALSVSFTAGAANASAALFLVTLALAVLGPGHRRECLLGWVLGMGWTFGVPLPAVIGGLLAALSAALHLGARPLLRRAFIAARAA